MGRLKRDHSGWRTSGLWLKYQTPTVNEVQKHKTKKDTRRWCRGKTGVEHDWHRYQNKRYDWEIDGWFDPWIRIECQSCKKKMYKRMAKTSHLPLHLFIESDYEYYEVPVRIS